MSLNTLKINHFGIVIPVNKTESIENEFGEKFIRDDIQGVSVCFVWDKRLNHYCEFITQEGRAKNYELGFNHICYDVEDQDAMTVLHKEIIQQKQGMRLTLPEMSPTENCNFVSFYMLNNVGIVEFNILNK